MLYAAQGCTAMNLYTPYGGTNHGSIGDPDTYCSYDYSACIREYGFVSLRYRLARLALYQLRACSQILCNSERDECHPYVTSQPRDALFSVRVCQRSQGRLLFLRNFQTDSNVMVVTLSCTHRGKTIVSQLEIPHRSCMTCVCNVLLPISRITVVLSALPLLMRAERDDADVLVFSEGIGAVVLEQPEGRQMQFYSDKPDAFAHTTIDGIVSLTLCAGAVVTVRCSGNADDSAANTCVLVCLSRADALTFTRDGGSAATWGAWHSRLDGDSVVAFALEQSLTINLLSAQTSLVTRLNFDLSTGLAPAVQLNEQLRSIEWRCLSNVWAMWPWRAVTGPLNDLQLDAVAGHIVYRHTFSLSAAEPVTIKISARHVMNMWLNGRLIAHNVAYSNPWRLVTINQAAGLIMSILPSPLIMKAGYSCGNDNPSRGSVSVTVQPPVVQAGGNELVVVVDNLGHQRQAAIHDDCRNPRGILSFSCSSAAVISCPHWSYASETTSNAANALVTHGVPADDVMKGLKAEDASNWKPLAQPFALDSDGVHWIRAFLAIPPPLLAAEKFPIPLRLSVSGESPPPLPHPLPPLLLNKGPGPASCLLWVNRRPVGRLHTFIGPQTSLYVPDGFWQAENEILIMLCVRCCDVV
jgi:hypothetical protein